MKQESRLLWNDAVDELTMGSQFIKSKIREISRSRKIINIWTSDETNKEKEILARQQGGLGRQLMIDIVDRLSVYQFKTDNNSEFDSIKLQYHGDNKALGVELLSFYSKILLPTLGSEFEENVQMDKKALQRLEILTQSNIIDEDEDEEDEEHERGLSTILNEKIIKQREKLKNSELMSGLLANTFSPVEIEILERKISDRVTARGFYFLILSCLLLSLILIITEFAGKTFTTEMQVSQYLEIRLIGTMNKIET
ncbi:MAG: hypothetical protein GY786_22330 [Proteobacteria bacterium]|nr:hypothetical protein [Pseudomonadota bacterium]